MAQAAPLLWFVGILTEWSCLPGIPYVGILPVVAAIYVASSTTLYAVERSGGSRLPLPPPSDVCLGP